ncbi:excisionase family DNA-binding protein [Oceanibaculum nanhaiense]|uniref:excisionase family DNA-binding protein n=1 Tax=Oceanibaculum nanhaiense TaxID=1909734 RepID=UPI003F710F97
MTDDSKRAKGTTLSNRAHPRRKTDPRRRAAGLKGWENGTLLRPLSVREFCARTSLGKTYVTDLISSGELPSILLGGRRLIPMAAAIEYLLGLPRVKPMKHGKKKG